MGARRQAAGDQRLSEATVTCHAIDCDVGIRLDPGKLTSDVLLDPHVAAIRLELIDLDVHRISKLGGKAAHELGDSFTPMLARQLKHREAKLTAKANASIAKHRDRLRLPVNAFITSGWAKLQSLLPAAAPTSSGSKKPSEPATTAAPRHPGPVPNRRPLSRPITQATARKEPAGSADRQPGAT